MPYTIEQQLKLWKWVARSDLMLKPRYANFNDLQYIEATEENDDPQQPQVGFCLVTQNYHGYPEEFARGSTEEDVIARAIWNQTSRQLGFTHVYRGNERWVEHRYYSFGRFQTQKLTPDAANEQIRQALQAEGWDFIDFDLMLLRT